MVQLLLVLHFTSSLVYMSSETIETADSSSSALPDAFGVLALVHWDYPKYKPRWTNTSRKLSRVYRSGALEENALQGRHGLAKILRCSRSSRAADLKQRSPEVSTHFPIYIRPLTLSTGRKRALLVSVKCVCKTMTFLKPCTRSELITKANAVN